MANVVCAFIKLYTPHIYFSQIQGTYVDIYTTMTEDYIIQDFCKLPV